MTTAKQIVRLGQISQLVLDVKLAALHSAASKRQHSLDLLDALNTVGTATDLSLVAQHQTNLRYQHWAQARRVELNLVLARQTADLTAARDEAVLVFGRNQAVLGLKAKHR